MSIKLIRKHNEDVDCPHISEDARKYAQNLWNKFNKDLLDRGLKLHYDAQAGSLFVAAFELEPAAPNEKGALKDVELEQVISEGCFDRFALNNPPWFVSPGDSTLKTK